jgi:hypothetical protein
MSAEYIISIWSLLLFFANLNPEDWDTKLLQNVRNYLPNATSYPILNLCWIFVNIPWEFGIKCVLCYAVMYVYIHQ